MSNLQEQAEKLVTNHPLFYHQFFTHWQECAPRGIYLAALFHQIQKFCASTRPGHNLPNTLNNLGFPVAAHNIQYIVKSESGHGAQLACMAAHILNRNDFTPHFDTEQQQEIEDSLLACSHIIFELLPGYNKKEGLLIQTNKAISIFERRKETNILSVAYSLGTTLALEIVSHRHLIPGEIQVLVTSGKYKVTCADPEMEYLREHGDIGGAEKEHEIHARDAFDGFIETVSARVSEEECRAIAKEMCRGADDFCERLERLWDVLDATLFGSGYTLTENDNR